MTNPNDDPFAGGDSAPSLSWVGTTPGTRRKIRITDAAKLVQSRDMKTKEPAVWKDGNPKMCAVLNGIDEQGEPVSIWASKPSSLFTAIKDAQAAVEKAYRIKGGDDLFILFESEIPASERGLSPQRVFKAKVEVGTAPVAAADDPWGADSSPAATSDDFGDAPF